MNLGLHDQRTGREMQATNFFLGAVVTNHKRYERELIPQYLKLRRKIETGARFIINQAGYDARKRRRAPALAFATSGCSVPSSRTSSSFPAARPAPSMRAGPGVVVTDELLALCEAACRLARQGPFVLLGTCGKQVAIARGARVPWRLSRRQAGAVRLRGDPHPSRQLRTRRMEGLRRRGAVRPSGRVLLLRARRHDRPVLLDGGPRLRRFASRRGPPGAPACTSRPPTARAAWHIGPSSTRRHRSSPSPAGSTPRSNLARTRSRTCCTSPSTRRRSHCSTARTAATARCRRSPICAPSPSARRTSATGPAAAPMTACARSPSKECIWARAYERLKPYGEEDSMLDGPVVFNDNLLR